MKLRTGPHPERGPRVLHRSNLAGVGQITSPVRTPDAGAQGSHYPHHSGLLDYPALARWCRARRGQTIVCEAAGADWLPFVPFGGTRGMAGAPSREAIWWQDSARSQGELALESA